jgi:L-ascorbate metabolism protein UlaG (beta-lactamase superfamily)
MLTFFVRLFKWRMGMSPEKAQPRPSMAPYIPQYAPPDLEKIKHPDPTKIQITWVGHSTFLIQVAGINIITDPIWSERASPIPWLGPKRHARPGITLADLPKIDVVLISHTHYDHLDRPTIKKLGAVPHFILPPNVASWFAQLGITNTTELLWWSDKEISHIKITAVPANHWSKRNLFGTSDAGWSGYMIESPAGAIYFAGDTGYHEEYFKAIGKKFSRIDVGLIPIGAYYPEWIFGRYYVNPNEAVKVHQEVGAQKSIGMHWGTFKLTEEPMAEPPVLLATEAAAAGLDGDEFTAMKIGETRVILSALS